jgi:glutaredoxin
MADFYKWVDEKGETKITDYPPPQDEAAKDVEIHKSPSEDSTNLQNEDNQKSQNKKSAVVIYTKNDCKDCDKAREFLKSKNIPFTEYNMDTDENAAAKRKEIDDGVDVPFAIINKNHVYGFSESVYDRVLKMEP